MKANLERIQSIKIIGDSVHCCGAVSVDVNEDGKRDNDFPRIRCVIDPELSVTVDGVEYTAEQSTQLMRKLAGKALRKEAKRMACLDDDMPSDVLGEE